MTQLPPHHHTQRLIERTGRSIEREGSLISLGISLMEFLMASNADTQAEYAKTKQAIIDDQVSDQAVVDGLDQVITDLRAGSVPNDQIIAQLQALQAEIKPVTSTSTPPTPAP